MNPGNYGLIVWRNRRPDGDDGGTWQARATWGSPEREATSDPQSDEILAITEAVVRMRNAQGSGS